MILKMLFVDSKGLCITGYHKEKDLVIFQWDKQCFCLIMKQKPGWLVASISCTTHAYTYVY